MPTNYIVGQLGLIANFGQVLSHGSSVLKPNTPISPLHLLIKVHHFSFLLSYLYIYITKNWSIVFNAAALMLRHISCHVILFFFFFSFLKYNLSYKFKMVFTIFQPYKCSPLLICLLPLSPYNKFSPLLIYLLPLSPYNKFSPLLIYLLPLSPYNKSV